MNRLVYSIKNAIKVAYWALLNPEVFQDNNFKLLCDLYVLIMKVAEEDRHRMTHIAYIHPTEGEKQIVSLWAGAGLGAEPTKRIAELLEENAQLKEQLNKHIKP